MRRMRTLLLSALTCVLVVTSGALAAGHGQEKPSRKGILLVAFGTTVPRAQVSFQNIEKRVKEAFPGVRVRWAFTSSIVRQKLAREGKQLDSVEIALARMMDEGFTHVAVQSLHTIAGEEFHDLRKNAHAFGHMAGGFKRVLVGYPLLAGEDDWARVATVLIRHVPDERKGDEAVVLMGHGTHHPSHASYYALLYHLQRKDPNMFMGTVEGAPTIEDIKAALLSRGIKKAYLMPFMAVAGDHAINDMAGDGERSWKSILTKAGISCVPILKGTAEYEGIVEIWTDHLRVIMGRL